MKVLKNIIIKREVVLMASLFLCLNITVGQLFNFKKISVEQGLSAHGVYAISEGPNGKLWIGLEGEGLNIYDGWEVTKFTDYHVGQNIRAVFRDSKNQMWIGSTFQGLSLITHDGIRRFSKDNGMPVNHIRGITEDANGGVWIATYGGGVVKIVDGRVNKNIGLEEGLPSLACKSILCKNGNEIWIGTDAGLAIFKDGNLLRLFSNQNGLPSNKVLAIKKGVDNDVWVGTKKGLARIKKGEVLTIKKEDGLKDDRIKDLLPISNKEVWLATRSGLGKLKLSSNNKTIEVKWYNDENGLSNNRIRCLYKDASQALWIGTYFGGVNRFFNESFSMYNKSSGLLDNVITAVSFNESDSSLWMGSHENGVDVWSENGLRSINKLVGLSENQVTSLAHFNKDLSLVGTNEGLNLIGGFEVERVWDSYDGLFEGNHIQSVVSIDNYAVALTNLGELFVIHNKEGDIRLDSSNTSLIKQSVESYVNSLSAVEGSFWIGSDSSLYEFVFKGGQIEKKSQLPINHVLKVSGGDDELVGYTGENQLFRLDSNQIIWDQKLKKSEEIKFLIKDLEGSYWFGLKGRVLSLKFEPNNVIHRSYSLNEGFMGESALRSAVTRDKEGNIYVGTIKGMLKFEPSGYIGVKRDLKVHFQNLLNDKIEYDWSKFSDSIIDGVPIGLVLPHRMNSV